MEKKVLGKGCMLKMNYMYYDLISFERCGLVDEARRYDFSPDAKCGRSITHRVENDSYDVAFSMEVNIENQYTAIVDAVANFSLDFSEVDGGDTVSKDEIEEMLNYSTICALYPFVREKLNTLTLQPLTTPAMLPITNIKNTFNLIHLDDIPDYKPEDSEVAED